MSAVRTRRRWSDHDRYFGPFTFAKADGYRSTGAVLTAYADDDDVAGCDLRLTLRGHAFIVSLPPILKPWRKWVDTSHHHWSGPSGGYWDIHSRQYGFSVSGSGTVGESTFLQVFLGAQTHDSSTTQSWSTFLPWTEWRHVRRSLYGLQGEHVFTEPKVDHRLGERRDWQALQDAQDACPSMKFAFEDFDGEALTAKTRIEEMEWRFGAGSFKWLSAFRRPMIRRSLDITFSGETGKRKGSWKGGTIGHSIDMRPGEMHEAAFRRYCAEHNMTFLRALEAQSKDKEEGE